MKLGILRVTKDNKHLCKFPTCFMTSSRKIQLSPMMSSLHWK